MNNSFDGVGLRMRPEVLAASLALAVILPLAALACGEEKDVSGVERGVTRSARTTTEPIARTSESSPPPPPVVETPVIESASEPVTVTRGEVSYEEAETAYLERRYDEAVTLFTLYTERKPENAWGHYMHGLSAWKAGDIERAEEAFGQALELDPDHQKSLINLARVKLGGGSPDLARELVEKVLEIEPESNQGHRLMARTLHEQGVLDEAIESYRRALTIDDTDAWSMNNLALIFIQQGRFEEALPPLARAVTVEDAIAIFWNNLGVALERTGHLGQSIEAFQGALYLDESYDKAAVSLARVEDRAEAGGTMPVDLTALSLAFQEEIGRWRVELVGEAATDTSTVEISVRNEE